MKGRPSRRALGPAEIAEAVVLADLSLALIVVGHFLPFGGAVQIAAVVPLAVVAARHRLRAVIAGAVAAAGVGFLVIGTGAPIAVSACAAFGALVGAANRRGWSRRRTIFMSGMLLWPPIALVTDLALLIFSELRKLTLDQVRNGWTGLLHLIDSVTAAIASIVSFFGVHIGQTDLATSGGKDILNWLLDHWYLTIPVLLLFTVIFCTWLAYGLATPALRRVRAAFGPPAPDAPVVDDERAPAPVPALLHDVSFRYANATSDALHDVSARVDAGEFLAIVGANGSGKSTLARLVAGRRAPTAGTVERPGAVALGRPGGTSFVFQRPEAQVLGVRVRDDVVWGLHDADTVDVDAVLDRVGLLPLAERETSTLSGGELQRLAVAAALARAPQLFVSDESTAMVDADGRVALVSLMRELADNGVAVVHVSHYAREADTADRVVVLEDGRVTGAVHTFDAKSAPVRAVRPAGDARVVISLRSVGHVYSIHTPWENRALQDVSLDIHEGESLLVVGHNGSGKSTLAWIVAGLLVPSEGEALIDGEPADEHIGRVGLSFQHARLQILRPTVFDEVKVAAGVDDDAARAALTAVGLDAQLSSRRIHELSGGQLRRVVLATVLARRTRALVLDEPFAGLDAAGRADLEALLVQLRDQHGIALMIVSHDRDLPPALLERVVELDNGRIVRDETVSSVAKERGAP
jgi:energy-coupling factor transport system ATP-binding protein